MDEVLELCRRILGAGTPADEVAAQVRAGRQRTRIARLAAAARACREQTANAGDQQAAAPGEEHVAAPGEGHGDGLRESVARELALATAALPERDREVLALRELLGLTHKDIARVMEVKPPDVALLLAEARLRFRFQRRGAATDQAEGCSERERTLPLLARRQDGELLSDEEGQWLRDHMAGCRDCETAHAAMLEASVNYRAWRVEEAEPSEAEPKRDP